MIEKNYFKFDSHYKKNSSSTSYADSYLSCYSANVNFSYRIGSIKFCVLPYMGIGLFDEYSQQRFKDEGSGDSYSPPEGGYPSLGGPYEFIDKYHSPTITGNVGFAAEYPVTDKIFVTGGIKYMIDLHDSKYSAFPCLNIGLGYRLK